MARVVLPPALVPFAGGARRLEVEAADVRALLRAIDARHPGFRAAVEEAGMAIAIDGEIVSDPLLEPISPDSEIHFLARIQGG